MEEGRYDLLSMTEIHSTSEIAPEGRDDAVVRERHYVPTEIRLLLQVAGFTVENIWGGTAGNWGRRMIDLDEYEMMVVSRAI